MNNDFFGHAFSPLNFWTNAVKTVVLWKSQKNREHKLLNIRFLQLNAGSSQDKGSTLLHKHKGVWVLCFVKTKAGLFLLEVAAL